MVGIWVFRIMSINSDIVQKYYSRKFWRNQSTFRRNWKFRTVNPGLVWGLLNQKTFQVKKGDRILVLKHIPHDFHKAQY